MPHNCRVTVPESSARVAVVVLNWNRWHDTLDCLEALSRQDFPGFKVIVCDNGSTDDSAKRIASWIAERPSKDTEFVLHFNGRNLGFSGGMNVGIREALTDAAVKWVWLLNNDTVPQPDALRQMVDAMEAVPRAGMCGSTMLQYVPRSEVMATCGRFEPRCGVAKHVAKLPLSEGSASRGNARQLDADEYPIGASLLLSRTLLERIGLLSEDYFLYYEELDLLHRIRLSFVAIVAPGSLVHHRVAAATGGTNGTMLPISDYCFARSRMHFTRLFYPAYRWSVLVVTLGSAARRLLRGRVRNAWAVLVGGWHGWRGLLGADLARRWLENR